MERKETVKKNVRSTPLQG